ncbi:hypothetical protein [Halomonas salipaludis]|uniref:hypothetical protein n=1 Tax=Halomonas salipaludis TaxID=2032625 RepID=UPI00389907DB
MVEASQDISLPESIHTQARRLLRHSPSRDEMLRAGQMETHLAEGTIFQPLLNATVDE